jgi:cytidine deaminase
MILLARVARRGELSHRWGMRIEWEKLREAAQEAAARAYAPYSRLRVGAAGLTSDGRVVSGCNVENASFGLTLCAECGLVSALHAGGQDTGTNTGTGTTGTGTSTGTPKLVAVVVVAGDGEPLVPCGRCRQLLLEAGGPELLVNSATGPVELRELLPGAFSGADITQRRDA